MNTARIVVQSVRPDDLQWQTWLASTASNSFIRRSDGAGTRALRSIVDVNAIEIAPTDQLNIRGAGVNVIRHGVASQTTTQK